jgi:cold shock protein
MRNRDEDREIERDVTGTVKFVNAERGFGFISRDDKQPKVFVHIKAVLEAGCDALAKGQRWLFDIVDAGDGKVEAANLRLLP